MITADIKKRVADKVAHCIAVVEKKYGITFKPPVISYNVRGTTGGMARYRSWEVDFNPILLKENLEHFIESTVPHEVAHLATELVYPHAHRRTFGQKRQPHGPHWAEIMRVLGADPKRCHTYDVENARVKRSTSYEYKCNCCGHTFSLGPKRHARQQQNNSYYHPACGKIAGRLVLAKEWAGNATAPAPVVKPVVHVSAPVVTHTFPAPTAPRKKIQVKIPTKVKPPVVTKSAGGESKLARCERLFENYPGYTRAQMINVFVQECDCTPAGAATYYANLKKKYGR